ncbi:hypothetical protein BOTBODRAFT_398174 [Botryobasidium botryosum FD-172 SS1]|uniref:Uncharacterized protein n=1 Tax=Botryobasidium botryosum (strain FD-172 SS1) TaxID=930990 RepID=A0A067MBS6_BOTB1|nr:hypothetical protein BOTBODRAFT_398174 [Botryobasidium botryosum FD-172 SS1]
MELLMIDIYPSCCFDQRNETETTEGEVHIDERCRIIYGRNERCEKESKAKMWVGRMESKKERLR